MRTSMTDLFAGRLRLPLIVAPMFRVSGLELVLEACRSGVIGAFPAANCRPAEELGGWVTRLQDELGDTDAPFCVNLIMRRDSLQDELACLCAAGVEIVITSVGNPAPVIPALHDAGCLVLADVTSIAHARKAIDAGADGLVLLSAGAGGQTGWANGIAFVRAVRSFFDGPVVLAGGLCDGQALLAARILGADMGYMGTRFIATHESAASQAYKEMLIGASMDDILRTAAFTGLDASILVPSIRAVGLSPHDLPTDISAETAAAMYGSGGDAMVRRWSDIWSAGHSVSGVHDIPSVRELVGKIEADYRQAREALIADMITG